MHRVVGDLMRNAGHRLESVTDLDSYIRRPRGIMGHVQARTLSACLLHDTYSGLPVWHLANPVCCFLLPQFDRKCLGTCTHPAVQ